MGPFADGWTNADVEAVLARADPAELLYVPIVVGMSADECGREWAEAICYKLSDHPDFTVRGNAVLGLGHIARTCGSLDLARAVPIISRALSDPHAYVRGQADSAASDVQVYLKVQIS